MVGDEANRMCAIGRQAMLTTNLDIDLDTLAEFCRRHRIRWLAVFGSALRDDFGPESDVDVLVEFEPEHVPGYRFITIQNELGQRLGRDVDLLTKNSLNRRIRHRVLDDAHVLYDAA
jgi:predicted nucleotidyltransferase